MPGTLPGERRMYEEFRAAPDAGGSIVARKNSSLRNGTVSESTTF